MNRICHASWSSGEMQASAKFLLQILPSSQFCRATCSAISPFFELEVFDWLQCLHQIRTGEGLGWQLLNIDFAC